MYTNPTLATLEQIAAGWRSRLQKLKAGGEVYSKDIAELNQLLEDLEKVIAELSRGDA